MLEYIKQLDVKLLVAINSLHTPFIDECMLVITHRYTWIPLYIFIIIFLFVKKKKNLFLVLFFIIGATICSDLFASAFMKPVFQRLRPCHDSEINPLLFLIKNNCGGRYGFISSHAATTFALVTFLYLYLSKEYKWVNYLFIWASVVALSRVYLGVHYPSDIAVGALAGILLAALFYYLFIFSTKKIADYKNKNE